MARRDAFTRLLAVGGLYAAAGVGATIALSEGQLWDLGAFIGSGRALLAGYDPYGPQAIAMVPDGGLRLPNLDPPLWLPLYSALALVNPSLAGLLWRILSLALYALIVWMLRPMSPRRWLLAFALWPLWLTLILGQVYIVFGLLSTIAWLALQREQRTGAAIALGALTALRPTFAVWPFFLALTGERRLAFRAGATTAALSLAPVAFYGPGIYWSWLTAMLHAGSGAGMAGFAVALGDTAGSRPLGLVFAIGAFATIAALSARWKPSLLTTSILALATSLGALPISNAGVFVVLIPVLLSLPPSIPLVIAVTILTVPWPGAHGTPLWVVYPVVLVTLLLAWSAERTRHSADKDSTTPDNSPSGVTESGRDDRGPDSLALRRPAV